MNGFHERYPGSLAVQVTWKSESGSTLTEETALTEDEYRELISVLNKIQEKHFEAKTG